jgi:hypothetical protein
LRRKGFIFGCLRRPERVDSISKALGKRAEAYSVQVDRDPVLVERTVDCFDRADDV